ncbi:hypothetical protein B0I35DRAFT_477280 [Stachybotrys elegans]|uniref:Uncharacterized protein n=1 Tax=Stachybotrys elegans TaxID=80388 RepID=A0A8K0WT22_9HYPO|nr:hypothetical protein B0I35DRAFT_477280 [Stachybotrys elegans]
MSSCKEAGRECAKFDHYLIQQKPFDANPDVAGVGVILATRLSAWFSFAVVLFVYVLEPSWKSGIFDMKVLFLIQSIRRRLAGLFFSREHLTRSRPQLDSSSPQRWRFLHGFGACGQTIIDQQLAIGRGFAACVQTISDQQLAIGIGLLLVSYIQHCSMTQYHFGIVYWLAWISFSVHQLAAQVVRLDARHNALSGAWRGALIFCFWPLLGVSNVIIHNDHFLAVLGLSTQCIWADPARISTAAGWIGLLLEQLIIAWATLDALRSYSKRIKRLIELLKVVLWIVLILVFAIGGILTSNLATILRVFIILLFANIGIDNLQMAAEKSKAMIGSERDWGFGQILPMLLLILPMLSVVQSLEETLGLMPP